MLIAFRTLLASLGMASLYSGALLWGRFPLLSGTCMLAFTTLCGAYLLMHLARRHGGSRSTRRHVLLELMPALPLGLVAAWFGLINLSDYCMDLGRAHVDELIDTYGSPDGFLSEATPLTDGLLDGYLVDGLVWVHWGFVGSGEPHRYYFLVQAPWGSRDIYTEGGAWEEADL